MKVATLPQLAGSRLLPNGCTSVRALYGLLSSGLMKHTVAASLEASCEAIVLYAFRKSTDHASRSPTPTCDSALTCAARASRSLGK